MIRDIYWVDNEFLMRPRINSIFSTNYIFLRSAKYFDLFSFLV